MTDEVHDGPADVPRYPAETLFVNTDGDPLAFVSGAIWPPARSVVQLGNPNRDALVREVRLTLSAGHATIRVVVQEEPGMVESTWENRPG